jgi:hypothetical protein
LPSPTQASPPEAAAALLRPGDPFAALPAAQRDALLGAADRHGLLGALAGRLPAGDEALRRRYARLTAGARLRDARAREVLEEVLALLAQAGVVPIALKGPLLADRIHPDPPLRPSGDLDLLVPEADLERSMAALAAAGFGRAPAEVDAYQRRRLHHLHLAGRPWPDVELHFHAAQLASGLALPAEDLFARALPHRTSRGTPLLLLSPEDELLALAVHAAGHRLDRAGWLLDLVLFLAHHPSLDWRLVSERAGRARCRRALACALGPASDLGAAVPAEVLGPLGPRRRALCARLARAARSRRGRSAWLLCRAHDLLLHDRAWDALVRVVVGAWWAGRRRLAGGPAAGQGRDGTTA